MQRLVQNSGNVLFPVILLIGINFICQTVRAQLLPEPVGGLMTGQAYRSSNTLEPGLLFYLSGSKDFTADFAAGGQILPNYLSDVTILAKGVYRLIRKGRLSRFHEGIQL